MKLYIYKMETKEVVAIAERETNEECEYAASAYMGCDEYGAVYDSHDLIVSTDYEKL